MIKETNNINKQEKSSTVDNRSDKEKIENGEWVNCYICEKIYKRKRETLRYCHQCNKGFCEGEHGTFEGRRFGICVRCYNLKN